MKDKKQVGENIDRAIPLNGLVFLVEGFNRIHDELFNKHKSQSSGLPQFLYTLEREIDKVLSFYQINPSELHELQNDGLSVREAIRELRTIQGYQKNG